MNTPSNNPGGSGEARKAIWVFTPSRTDAADLEFILVQRHSLLQDAVERVRESALTDHKHHLLFVGPRGCGKTHFVTLLVSRLGQFEDLADRLRIAWLNEDATCTTLLELLLKVHEALEKRYPDEFHGDALARAFDLKPDDALNYISAQILASIGNRTLLVLAENLDAIFDGLGDSGQKQLRAFIQENSRITIVATAQRLVENLSSRTSPFFGFFQTEHLKPLKVGEATELLKKIARLHNQDEVVEFLSTSRGRSRVRALHHLSGGNHRIYIVLSQFISRDSIDALIGPFMKMVDELTPYYQERVRWLPPLQRKIVEYLCTRESTVPVKEIAKRLFATPPTISSQLQSLREKGYVEARQRGREFLYEVSEPLMRICVEVKDNQSHEPIRFLVDFLRIWYDNHDLSRRQSNQESAGASREYVESAVERKTAIKDFTAVIELPDAPIEQIALALFRRGIAHGQAGESQHAIEDYAAVINMSGTPRGILVDACLALSGIYFGEGRWGEGFDTLDKGLQSGATEQPPYFGSAADLIAVVFSAGLSPEGRRAKVGELVAIYQKHHVLTALGEGVVEHIGKVYRAGKPFPSPDNLDQWLTAWDEATAKVGEFRLSLRVLQTGIAFVKSGGKESGILLDLTSPEREILKQTLGLAEAEED